LRATTLLAVLGLASLAPARAELPPERRYETVDVAEGIFAFVSPETTGPIPSGNVVAIVGGDGVLIVDSGRFPALATRMAADIRRRTDKPVRWLVHTHWHADHSGGNGQFAKAGAVIVAQREALTRMSSDQYMAAYKRTVPGTWAPINSTWGDDNRTTAIRSIAGSSKSTRIELRLSAADINPYLAMAASLAAGLEGIERKLQPCAPVTNGYKATSAAALPADLSIASAKLRESQIARKWFGDEFVDHYCGTRDWEWRQYQRAITDWELARYFESI